MDRLEQEHPPGKGAILVAEIDNRIVGCGMIREIAPRIGEIKRVFVEDRARGHGAGKALMRDAMTRARADFLSARVVECQTVGCAASKLDDY